MMRMAYVAIAEISAGIPMIWTLGNASAPDTTPLERYGPAGAAIIILGFILYMTLKYFMKMLDRADKVMNERHNEMVNAQERWLKVLEKTIDKNTDALDNTAKAIKHCEDASRGKDSRTDLLRQ